MDGTGKNQLEPGHERMRDAAVLSHWSLLRNPWPNRQVCWSIVLKTKPTVGSPFFGAFPSDRIPKATKDVTVHFFTHSYNSYKLYQRIPGNFEATTYFFRTLLKIRHLLDAACASMPLSHVTIQS